MIAARALIASTVALAFSALPVGAQVLQNGDILVGTDDGIQRLRNGTFTNIIPHPGYYTPSFMAVDGQGRVVWVSGPCGGNYNNNGLFRGDPATGQSELLYCLPYIATPGTLPSAFPADSSGMYGVGGMCISRTLRMSIDDDANGGVPQVSTHEAYCFTTNVRDNAGYHPMAMQYDVDSGTIEQGTDLSLLGSSSAGPILGSTGSMMYAGAGSGKIGKAGPALSADFHLHAEFLGTPIHVDGHARVQPKNELLFDGTWMDNTAVPNHTMTCNFGGVSVTDTSVPEGGSVVSGIYGLGFVEGGLFFISNSASTPGPLVFDLALRDDPSLNGLCSYAPVASCNLPDWDNFYSVQFGQDTWMRGGFCVDGNRVLGVAVTGKLIAVNSTSLTVLATGLGYAQAVAVPSTSAPPITQAALVVRIDSPVNVLVTDGAGKRIGKLADGTEVNDYGAGGSILNLGPEGHPTVYTVGAPAPGHYTMRMVGTGSGPYTVRGYTADTGVGGTMTAISGTAAPGVVEMRGFGVTRPLGLRFGAFCMGDFNNSGAANVQDIFDYLGAWFAGSAEANVNGVDGITIQDIFDFLAAWFAPCG